MDSTLSRLLAFAAVLLAPLTAAALNHELEVAPLARGPFTVACSNIEHDTARLAQLGGLPADYWEGHQVGSETRYVTDILAHPESAVVFRAQTPFKPFLYPSRFGQRVEFAAIVCHPTPRANADPNYQLPGGGGVVPHMLPAGASPRLLSAAEYGETLGISFSPVPPAGPAALPFIVYSHGLGGSPLGKGYIDVMVELASHGFMVAAVFHADARFSLIRVEDFGDFAYTLAFFPFVVEMELMRPVALKAMTDVLLDDPGFSPAIDRDRIGGFGASLGGQAMANLVGARITSTLARSCDDPVRDPRIRAVVGYVPYSGQSFLPAFCDGQSGAAGVNRPYLAIAGTADTTAPIKMTEQAVNLFGDSHYLVELVGGQHELRPEDAGDVLTWMVTFFNAYLDVRTDTGAMARFIKMRSVRGGRLDVLTVDVHVPFANVGGETRAVEFYNTGLGHYFMAAAQGEVDAILSGSAGPAWELTRQSFKVWPQMPSDTFTGVGPVCRFYGGRNGGPNSHFFTAEPSECDLVKASPGWLYEGIGFYIRPVGVGRCPSGYLEVNRAYNRRASQNDTNHRFSTSDSTMEEMARRGWVVEGTVMCARP